MPAYHVLKTLPRAEAGNDVDLSAERGDMVCCGEDAAGEQFVVLIARGDNVFFWRLANREYVLILVDDRVANENHAIVADSVEERQYLAQTAIAAQRAQMFANMRFEHVEVAIYELA